MKIQHLIVAITQPDTFYRSISVYRQKKKTINQSRYDQKENLQQRIFYWCQTYTLVGFFFFFSPRSSAILLTPDLRAEEEKRKKDSSVNLLCSSYSAPLIAAKELLEHRTAASSSSIFSPHCCFHFTSIDHFEILLGLRSRRGQVRMIVGSPQCNFFSSSFEQIKKLAVEEFLYVG